MTSLSRIRAITDPASRACAAAAAITAHQHGQDEARTIRDDAIRVMAEEGVKRREIAELVGVSEATVKVVLRGRKP